MYSKAQMEGLLEHPWDVCVPVGARSQAAKDNKIISVLNCRQMRMQEVD